MFFKKILLLGLLSIQSLFAQNLNLLFKSTHFEILCSEKDISVCEDLLEASEKVYKQCCEEFHHQLDYTIQVHLFPDLVSFHRAIQQEEAPDWLVYSFRSPMQMVSPLNPGSYHPPENIKKALLKELSKRLFTLLLKSALHPGG